MDSETVNPDCQLYGGTDCSWEDPDMWCESCEALADDNKDEEKACNCAPDIHGRIVHNSWAHPEWDDNPLTALSRDGKKAE